MSEIQGTAWATLRAQLIKHEGFRQSLYSDNPQDNLEEILGQLKGKLTIGVGFNIQDNEIPVSVVGSLLDESINIAVSECKRVFEFYDDLDVVRKCTLVNMMFNLGAPTLLKFKNMVDALKKGDWERASVEMLDSRWARQVGRRAKELSAQMLTGEWKDA